MNRLAFAGAALLLAAVSFAADLGAITRSQAALSGAITGLLGDEFLQQRIHTHLPGYGLQLTYYVPFDAPAASEVAPAVAGLLTALGGTLQGLDAGDWISVYIQGTTGFGSSEYRLLVRMRPGDAGSLEVWRDGALQ